MRLVSMIFLIAVVILGTVAQCNADEPKLKPTEVTALQKFDDIDKIDPATSMASVGKKAPSIDPSAAKYLLNKLNNINILNKNTDTLIKPKKLIERELDKWYEFHTYEIFAKKIKLYEKYSTSFCFYFGAYCGKHSSCTGCAFN